MSDRSTRINLENDQEQIINPATEDKQDTIITDLGNIESNQTNGTQRTKIYANSADVDTQHPLPTNGDSVYAKDIDTSWSSVGTFTGSITDLVDDLDTTFSSTWHSSPANFTIKFKRPVVNSWIKFCSPVWKNFSNTKITLKDRSWAIVFTVDESTDNTDKTNEEFFWPLLPYCTILVEFYTTDDVDINWVLIEKSVETHSNIKFLDSGNSTTTVLVWDDSWTWEWIKTTNFSSAIVNVTTDQDAATNWLEIQLSDDGSTIRHKHVFSPLDNTPNWHHYPATLDMQYMRIKYTNWTTTQTSFALFTTLFTNAPEEWHAHWLDYPIEDDHPASIVRNINVAKKPNGDYVNINATTWGNLKFSLEEYDDAVNPIRKDIEWWWKIAVWTTAVEVTFTWTTTNILITADIDNTWTLYVWESNVTNTWANALTYLLPWDSLSIDYDDTDNALYVVGSIASQNFWKWATL